LLPLLTRLRRVTIDSQTEFAPCLLQYHPSLQYVTIDNTPFICHKDIISDTKPSCSGIHGPVILSSRLIEVHLIKCKQSLDICLSSCTSLQSLSMAGSLMCGSDHNKVACATTLTSLCYQVLPRSNNDGDDNKQATVSSLITTDTCHVLSLLSSLASLTLQADARDFHDMRAIFMPFVSKVKLLKIRVLDGVKLVCLFVVVVVSVTFGSLFVCFTATFNR
jgi:hypothetical protein